MKSSPPLALVTQLDCLHLTRPPLTEAEQVDKERTRHGNPYQVPEGRDEENKLCFPQQLYRMFLLSFPPSCCSCFRVSGVVTDLDKFVEAQGKYQHSEKAYSSNLERDKKRNHPTLCRKSVKTSVIIIQGACCRQKKKKKTCIN